MVWFLAEKLNQQSICLQGWCQIIFLFTFRDLNLKPFTVDISWTSAKKALDPVP
jgi:hypothetical protein